MATHLIALSDPLRDWLDLGLRWLHVIAAMAWIGTRRSTSSSSTSRSVRPTRPTGRPASAGSSGRCTAAASTRSRSTSSRRRGSLDHVAWFKQARTRRLSGFALMLSVLLLLRGPSALVKPGDDLEPLPAIAISIGLLVIAWIAYDVLNRLVTDARVLWPVLIALVALAAWGSSSQPARGVAPGRRDDRDGDGGERVLRHHPGLPRADPCAGGGPRAGSAAGHPGEAAPVHNNYLTLPVLLTMLAGHFPFAYGADHALARARRADGDRGLGTAPLQPPSHGTHALVDARGGRRGLRRRGRRGRPERGLGSHTDERRLGRARQAGLRYRWPRCPSHPRTPA